MGLSYTSVQGYLPHNRVYNLDTMSAECERIKLYRSRKRAFEELKTHLSLPDETVWLWRCVIAFENYPFKTAGRGGKGGVKFKYTVSRERLSRWSSLRGRTVSGFAVRPAGSFSRLSRLWPHDSAASGQLPGQFWCCARPGSAKSFRWRRWVASAASVPRVVCCPARFHNLT